MNNPAFELTVLPDEKGYIFLLSAAPCVPKHVVDGALLSFENLCKKHGGTCVFCDSTNIRVAKSFGGIWRNFKVWALQKLLAEKLPKPPVKLEGKA
jgi:hypothetical protein